MTRSAIMSKAWSLYNEITGNAPECRSRAQFGLCLRAAWEQANTARTARREWDTKAPNDQYTALIQMVWSVKRKAVSLGREADVDWIKSSDDAATVADDAWIRLRDAFDRNDQADDPKPLAYLMYAACAQAAHSVARSEIRHVTACTSADAIQQATPDMAGGQSLLDLLASVTASPVACDPADGYTIRAAIAAAATDDIAHEIITQLAAGYTVRDIADHIGMSKSAVQRRVDKIRAIIAAQIYA